MRAIRLTVQRGDHGGRADTKTSDESTNEDGGDVTHGGCLHDGSNDGKDGGEDQVVSTADLVGDDASAERSDETAALQGGDNVGLKIGLCDTIEFCQAIGPAFERQSLSQVAISRNHGHTP